VGRYNGGTDAEAPAVRPDDIRNKLRRVPFEPFRIRLSNNAVYDIAHPDQAAVGRSAIIIGIPAPDLPPDVADQFVEVSLLHVAEFLPMTPLPPLPPPSNGQPPA
jgi:hypothetical protein